MGGYQTIEAVRPALSRSAPPAPIVLRELVRPTKPRRGRGYPLKASQVKEIIRRREAGESVRGIARALGVSHQPVSRYARHVAPPEGGWVVPTKPRKEYNVAKALRLRRAGFTYQEIGDEIGCSLSQARVLIGVKKRGGIKLPIARFVRSISEVTGFPSAALRRREADCDGRSSEDLARARHVMFWLAHRRLGWSYPLIGRSFGGFNHTSILYGVRRIDAIAEGIDFGASTQIGRAARRLWNADWTITCR